MSASARRPDTSRRTPRPSRTTRRIAVAAVGVGCLGALAAVTTAPAQAAERERVRFDCRQNGGVVDWTAPAGVEVVHVELQAGEGGSTPGKTGRGGKGANADADLVLGAVHLTGTVGCGGDDPGPGGLLGGPGGTAGGDAEDGAAGGSGSRLRAVNPAKPYQIVDLWVGGGGGGGGRGTGFGINSGGDGGSAGRSLSGGRGPVGGAGDQGTDGGGLGGGTPGLGTATCLAPIDPRFGQPGEDADPVGGGGGGGGGGYSLGGCGGGAGSAVVDAGKLVVGSGGGGQAGGSSASGSSLYIRYLRIAPERAADGFLEVSWTAPRTVG